jgi:predicted phage terminase large subunit-like protein
LESFAEYIEIPGTPVGEMEENAGPAVNGALALHHRIICQATQRTIERDYGRLMILAPAGSAKSSYAAVAAPAWIMGKKPGSKIILASHGSTIATKQSKRSRQLVRSERYRTLFETQLPADQRAADEWALTNGSSFMAGGILSGLTGNRADVVIADDLLKGRDEAESETIREKTWEAFRDDLRSRLVPGGSMIVINTRWHQSDVSGMILPSGWEGQSGTFTGSDGLQWEVVCLPSKIETQLQEDTDPCGRKRGEYLWPEWFKHEHWVQNDPALGAQDTNTPTGRRAWYSMHQQQPHPDDGILFRKEDFRWYERGEEPRSLRKYGASDWALTDELLKPDPDYTEHGVCGIDDGKARPDGRPRLYILDWIHMRKEVTDTVPAFVRMVDKHRPLKWFWEAGNIDKAIGPSADRDMRDYRRVEGGPRTPVWVDRELLPIAGVGNKVQKATGFKMMVERHQVWLPMGEAWAERLVNQLCGFPGLLHDDGVDVCSHWGRAIDQMFNAATLPPAPEDKTVKFGTVAWLLSEEKHDSARPESYYR